MKLSDAIALGRVAVTPRRGVLLEADGGGCALGMAGLASGVYIIGEEALTVYSLAKDFAWAFNDEPICPCKCTGMERYKVSGIIGHIFDVHVMGRKDWTLDQLIDWVRSVEPEAEQEDAKQVLGKAIERQKERIEENELEWRADLVRGEEE